MSEIRYHVMAENAPRSPQRLIACRASEEGANVERDRYRTAADYQAAADGENKFIIVWVDRVPLERCTCNR